MAIGIYSIANIDCIGGTFDAHFILKMDWVDENMITEEPNPHLCEGCGWNDEKDKLRTPNIVSANSTEWDAYEKEIFVKNHKTGLIQHFIRVKGQFK
jgi:hypothetical protein